MHRGEIWWANLPEPRGSEPGDRRPVLVLQSNSFNRSGIQTVVSIVLTSNLRLADAPGNVLLPARESGLPKDSVANVSQIVTIDKSFFTDCVGVLPDHLFRRIEAGVRLVTGLH